jgi:hypothetical protein
MGLDQYADRRGSNGESCEISYWRKHNALQGWMETLWSIKTGKPTNDLNCTEVELTSEDLDQLQKCIQNQTLPQTQGFFFGSDTSRDETRQEYDLEFVRQARVAIKEGDKVFYSCSW